MATGSNHWISITVPNTTSLDSIPTIPPPTDIVIVPQRFIIIPNSIINGKRQILSPLPCFPRSTVRIPPSPSRDQERPALSSPSLAVAGLDPRLAFYVMYADCSLVCVLADRIDQIGSCKCYEEELP
jgi:hypothetical protein